MIELGTRSKFHGLLQTLSVTKGGIVDFEVRGFHTVIIFQEILTVKAIYKTCANFEGNKLHLVLSNQKASFQIKCKQKYVSIQDSSLRTKSANVLYGWPLR